MNKFFLSSWMVIMTFMGMKSAFAEVTKKELCSTSKFISAKVSPDGKYIVHVGADENGIANAFIQSAESKDTRSEQLSLFTDPAIIQFFWSPDSKKVLLLKDANGTGRLNLHGFDIESKKHISYTEKFPKVNAKLMKLSVKDNRAVVGLNHRNPQFHDLYLLDLDSGEFTLLLENDVYAKFLISDALEIVLKMRINRDGSWTILTSCDDVFMTLSAEEAFQTEFISYNDSEDAVYLLDNRFSNTNQLTKKGLSKHSPEEVLGGQPLSDVDEVIFIGGKPNAYASYYTQKKWHVLDKSIQDDVNFLEKNVGTSFEVVSQSQDSGAWIVSNSIPDQGIFFWFYERASQSLRQLSPMSFEKAQNYSKMYEFVTKARDGETLVCYYTLPKEYDKGGTVESPIPLVVFPHGGPFKVRDRYEFNPDHQWLASCGYAVLSVNFRHSAGFGKAFVNAGNGEWGGKAHLDVIDAAEACVDKGITEKGKLAIFGGSYGGYESLAALTFTPEYFTCCVAICGPSNLKTVLGCVPEFWELTSKPLSDKMAFFTKQAFIKSMGGDPEDPAGAAYLEKCSPLKHLDGIQVPLLLVHGQNDHVVVESESRQIYDSMKMNNKTVTYMLFPNEGHRFANFSNKMMYLNRAERFLSEHLHGKYRPVEKEAIADSTVQIFN